MNFKKFIVFFTFIMLIFNAYSLNYNETYEEIKLDVDGWCTNFPIFFTIYNNTEYTDSDFQDDLCSEGEDPVNDTCDEYKEVDASLVIFDGPFDGLTELIDIEFEDNEMNYTFTKDNQYLVQVIIDSGKYNDYEEKIIIEECNIDNEVSGSNVQAVDTFNNSFEYSSSQTTITLENSNIEEKGQVNVKLLFKTSDRSLPPLSSNLSKILEVEYEDLDEYDVFSLETIIDTDNESYLEVYKYENMNWTNVTDYTLTGFTLIVDEVDSNYYAFVINEPPEVIEEVIIEEVVEEIPIEEQVIVVEDTGEDSSGPISIVSILAYGGLFLVIVIIAFFLFSNNSKKSKDDDYSDYDVKSAKDSDKKPEDTETKKREAQDAKAKEKEEKEKLKQEEKERKEKEKEEAKAAKEKEAQEKEAQKKEADEAKAKEKEAAKTSPFAEPTEKKEGFFAKLFKKKEKDDSSTMSDVKSQVNPVETKKEEVKEEPKETTEPTRLVDKTVEDANQEVIDKTREYVKKYKDTYPQDGIRQSLKSVNISEEVIDKVFSEEY